MITVRADADLTSRLSLRFVRDGDLRGAIAIGPMRRGKIVQARVPARVCSGVVLARVVIQTVVTDPQSWAEQREQPGRCGIAAETIAFVPVERSGGRHPGGSSEGLALNRGAVGPTTCVSHHSAPVIASPANACATSAMDQRRHIGNHSRRRLDATSRNCRRSQATLARARRAGASQRMTGRAVSSRQRPRADRGVDPHWASKAAAGGKTRPHSQATSASSLRAGEVEVKRH